MQHPENRLWKLLALKFSGEATPEELAELNIHLETSADLKNIVNNIEIFWNQKNDEENTNDEMEEERFHLILTAEDQDEINDEEVEIPAIKPVRNRKYKWFYAAASIILLLGLALFFKLQSVSDFNSSFKKSDIQKVFVKPGSKSKIILPDGTIVRLNGSSKLSYNSGFNKNVREVDLDGEAYFDVTKDAKHPFIVHTSNIDIKVLGTLFNVKSYKEDPTIETTLLRGSVEVFNKNDASALKVILKPNEKLVFRKNEKPKVPATQKNNVDSAKKFTSDDDISISTLSPNQPDSLKEEISWVYNKLVINGDNFSTMALKMERWYGVKIEIMDTVLDKYHFTGIFEKETIEQALNALQLTVKFRYSIKDNVVKIKE